VLDGRLVFELDGERTEATAGDFVAVPPLAVHTFRNEGPGDARFLNLHAPSKGFIEHLRNGGDPDRFDTYDPSERQEGSSRALR
jgi:mannose-6-phosphate isomerase-like protein (cupin superfamily)